MDITLRDYQKESINRILASYEQNKTGSELLVLPCSAGKTIIFSQIIHQLFQKYATSAMVVAHTDVLLDQAADKYRMVKPDAIIGKIGSGVHQYGGEVTVASVATISRPEHIKRLKAFYTTGKGLLLIIDEGHHSMAQSYQTVLEAFPDAFVLIVTATPDRLDGKPLLDGKPAIYSIGIIDMIQQGYLCDMKAIAIKTHLNLDQLHTQAGDYKIDELEAAVDTPARNQRIVAGYLEHANGRRAACFAVTVNHAQNLADAFNSAGVEASVIVGETPLDERKKLYKAFRDGSVKVLATVNVLSEGWDEPLCDCIIMARPTQSRALFVQAIGRGLRLSPGKQNCVVLDITDNCLKHRLEPQNLRKVLGKPLRDEETILEALAREEEEIGKKTDEPIVRKLKQTRDQDITLDILAKLDWQLRDNGMFVLEVGKEKHRLALVPSDGEEDKDMWGGVGYYSVWARLAPLFEPQCWVQSAPLDWAQQVAEKRARMLLSDAKNVTLVDKNAPWRNYGASEKQIEMLTRFGVKFDPETITKGAASDILDPIFEKLKAKKAAKERAG